MLVLAAGLLAPALAHAEFFQAPFGPGGSWRIYETFPGATLTFKEALAEAQSRLDPVTGTVRGNLVSITSTGKEKFIQRTLNQLAGDVWIGLVDREGLAAEAEESQTFGAAGEANRINGWRWTNGDAYDYRNWGPGEPNDSSGEDAAHFGGGQWNDNKSGFGTDDPEAPVLQPGTSGDESSVGGGTFRYIVEYSTNAPSPYSGIRRGSVFPSNAELPIPPNTAGHWSVQEARDLPLVGNIIDSITQLFAGGGTLFNTQSPYLDFTDPDGASANVNGGPIITATAPFPYLSNGVDVDDNNILVAAKTSIIIPASGAYTIQVRSDDGFALRVRGQAWSAVSGAGYIDPLDPSTIVYETGTGDANTRGAITLAAGQYDLDFVTWEGGGGAWYEVTSATGTRLNAGEAQWLPLGSDTVIPEINTLNAVHLKTEASVANANIRDRGNVLPAMRNIIETAILAGTATTGSYPNLEIGEGDMPNNNGGDNYITKIEGTFTVDADADEDGVLNELIDITFGLFCDDGASLRIIGQDFTAVSANSTNVDNGGDLTLTADFYTGNTDSRGRLRLTEGTTYGFVAYMYEGGGGSVFNLRWKLGDWVTGFAGGETALRTEAFGDDALNLTTDATVTNSSNEWGTVAYVPLLPRMRAIMNEATAQGVVNSASRPIVLLRENGDGSITGSTFAGTAALMPVGTADNYATKVSGRLIVNDGDATPGETLTVTFGVFADDGADLRIVGQDFISVTDQTGDGVAALEEVEGDKVLAADYFTGNTNAFGTIELVEGEYDFEGHHYEAGGGSGYEVWWALGSFTAFDSAAFRPLNNNAGLFLPGNAGIALAAAQPVGSDIRITAFSYNPATGAYSVTFTSEAGANYAVQYSSGLQAGAAGTAARWNVVPTAASVPGTAGTTTVTGSMSGLITPTGLLPDGSTSFFRVQKL